jgi:hypothetical protein
VRVTICSALALSMGFVAAQSSRPASPRDLLREVAQVNDAEWASLERGEAVAKVLDTDSREIAVAGAVRIAGSSEQLLDRYRDIDNLKRSAIVIDVGRFSRPPQTGDLARAPLEEYSLDLRGCRPYECHVRLSERDIARFHREVDWRRPDWRDRSRAIWQDVLVEYVAAYSRAGRSALPVYANKREALSVSSELAGVVRQFAFAASYAPELVAYMGEFAPPLPPGAEEMLYWTKEDFGVRPIFRISHQVIHPRTGRPVIAIATNQVYADHYLDAALTLTLAIDATTSDGRRAFYLVSVSRARTRSLTGLLRAFVRSTVQGRTRDALRKILTSTRASFEMQSR